MSRGQSGFCSHWMMSSSGELNRQEEQQTEERLTYLTKELANKPTRATAAPPTAVTRQPRRSVKMLTMGEQKKIMPMEREPTQAEGHTGEVSTHTNTTYTHTQTHTTTIIMGRIWKIKANQSSSPTVSQPTHSY